MFVLSTIKHTVEIVPNAFGRDFLSTLVEQINKHFSNFVIPDVGLCITFYDFKKIGDSYILPGNASTHTPVIFRYVVFQPVINEILEGQISQSARDGITISMHFFNDIKISPERLPNVSKFDEMVQIWNWEYINEEKITPFYMDPGKRVRFKVLNVRYRNVQPGASADAEMEKAMMIEATLTDMGLGCINWWETNDSDEIKQEIADYNER